MSPFGESDEDHVTPNEVDDSAVALQPRGGESGAEQDTHILAKTMTSRKGLNYTTTMCPAVQIRHNGSFSDSPAASVLTDGDDCDISLLPSSLTASTV